MASIFKVLITVLHTYQASNDPYKWGGLGCRFHCLLYAFDNFEVFGFRVHIAIAILYIKKKKNHKSYLSVSVQDTNLLFK